LCSKFKHVQHSDKGEYQGLITFQFAPHSTWVTLNPLPKHFADQIVIATGMQVAKMKKHVTLGTAVMDPSPGCITYNINLCFKKNIKHLLGCQDKYDEL
jgi:hypothetical protein